jgi:DNA primase large subunit
LVGDTPILALTKTKDKKLMKQLKDKYSAVVESGSLLDEFEVETEIKKRLATQKSELEAIEGALTRKWLEEYVWGEHDIVEQVLAEFGLSTDEVDLEYLRDFQHDLINYLAK